jgi:hypothetical protein
MLKTPRPCKLAGTTFPSSCNAFRHAYLAFPTNSVNKKKFELTYGKSSNAAKATTLPSRSSTVMAKYADSMSLSILG